jgi:hypothetical protein
VQPAPGRPCWDPVERMRSGGRHKTRPRGTPSFRRLQKRYRHKIVGVSLRCGLTWFRERSSWLSTMRRYLNPGLESRGMMELRMKLACPPITSGLGPSAVAGWPRGHQLLHRQPTQPLSRLHAPRLFRIVTEEEKELPKTLVNWLTTEAPKSTLQPLRKR